MLGAGIAVLVAVATAAAMAPGSPLRAGAPEGSDLPSTVFLVSASLAFAAYVTAVVVLRRSNARLAMVCAAAAAIQLMPLAGPLVLSQDVGSYWAYGRLAEEHGADPYAVPPARFPRDPAARAVAPAWRGSTSVYGPAFTAASAGLAELGGHSAERVAFEFRLAASVGMLALVGLAAVLSPAPAFAAAFVGWNPLLAIDFAGGGHNDVWMMVLVLAALALTARRPVLAGAGWALAVGVKFVALGLLPLRLLAAGRAEAARTAIGFAAAAACIAGGRVRLLRDCLVGRGHPVRTSTGGLGADLSARSVRRPELDGLRPAPPRVALARSRRLCRPSEARGRGRPRAARDAVAPSVVRGLDRAARRDRGGRRRLDARDRPVRIPAG